MVVSSFDQVSYEVKNLKNMGLLIDELVCSKKGFFCTESWSHYSKSLSD